MKAEQSAIRTVDVHDRAGNVVGSKDVVLYAGLLDQAHAEGLTKVRTSILQIPIHENGRLAVVKAEVETTEEPLNLLTKRAHLLNMIADEVRERAIELRMELLAPSPINFRQRLTGNPHSTKIDAVEHLAWRRFGQLATLTPKRAARAALGLRPRDKYWLRLFDALAIGVVLSQSVDSKLNVT